MKLSQLTEEDRGKWVWYKPTVGAWEKGRIKSWNSTYIFVVYKCNDEWKRYADFTGQATDPSELHYIEHQDHCRAALGFTCSCIPETTKVEQEDFI